MNVMNVTPNIPVIPTTQRSQVQGLRDVPKNCQPQPASQRKWDYETRSQTGKFNIPRPLGHEPGAETRFTLPEAETRFTLPEAETRFTLPEAETRFTLPKVETRFTLPKVETRFTLPKVETRFTLPKTKPFDSRRAGAWSRPSNDWYALGAELILGFICLVGRMDGMKKAEKEAEMHAFREKWRPFFCADPAKFRQEDMKSTFR